MDIKELRKLCPPTHVILPIEVVEKLVIAGYIAYGPAAIQAGTNEKELENAARSAENTLNRTLGAKK